MVSVIECGINRIIVDNEVAELVTTSESGIEVELPSMNPAVIPIAIQQGSVVQLCKFNNDSRLVALSANRYQTRVTANFGHHYFHHFVAEFTTHPSLAWDKGSYTLIKGKAPHPR